MEVYTVESTLMFTGLVKCSCQVVHVYKICMAMYMYFIEVKVIVVSSVFLVTDILCYTCLSQCRLTFSFLSR